MERSFLHGISRLILRSAIQKTLEWYQHQTLDIIHKKFPEVILFDSYLPAAKRYSRIVISISSTKNCFYLLHDSSGILAFAGASTTATARSRSAPSTSGTSGTTRTSSGTSSTRTRSRSSPSGSRSASWLTVETGLQDSYRSNQ